MRPTFVVAYLVLFAGVGFLTVLAALLLGRLIRARAPSAAKLETYECGEPSIGSSFVQFDLRFYVVALLFIIFEVEAAFFFPWAVVYRKATELADPGREKAIEQPAPSHVSQRTALAAAPRRTLESLGVRDPDVPKPAGDVQTNQRIIESSGRQLALASLVDVAVFFGVVLVGFAYVWSRGDLDWVRAVAHPVEAAAPDSAGTLSR